MMRLAEREIQNTGDPILLHPQNKKPIGIRHALLALEQTYGKSVVSRGPGFRKQTVKGSRITLHFDSVGTGLMSAKPEKINSFAVAGADRKWHWADAIIKYNTVIISSPAVAVPVAVRYAWAMNPSQRNLLYNKEGLPASPFRTDDWPLFRPGKDESIDVNKPKKPSDYTPQDWTRPAMTP